MAQVAFWSPGGAQLGNTSLLSSVYIRWATPICLRLLKQLEDLAAPRAAESAGSSIAANMAMMAITTNNSIRVNCAEDWKV